TAVNVAMSANGALRATVTAKVAVFVSAPLAASDPSVTRLLAIVRYGLSAVSFTVTPEADFVPRLSTLTESCTVSPGSGTRSPSPQVGESLSEVIAIDDARA